MSIHKTRFGTYEVKYREGRKQLSKTFKTPREAEVFQERIEHRRAEGKPIMRRKDVPTLEEFAADWFASRGDLADSTRNRYLEQLETHVLPDLGHLPLLDLRPRRLAEWQRDRLADGAGPAVLGKAQALLSQILDKAVLPYEYLDVNPVLALGRPAYKKRQHRWLTAAEVEALRQWFLERDDLGSAALVSVLGYVGIRPQDALARTRADLASRLSVTSKNSDGVIVPGSKTGEHYNRTVYVPELVQGDIEEWIADSDSSLLFPRRDGAPWTKSDYDNWRSRHPKKGKDGKRHRPPCFKAAAEAVGLGSNLRPYDLRHTCATLCAAAGWNHVEIAHQLGHSPTESQRTYQHLLHEEVPGERRTIDDYIREARGIAPEPTEDVRSVFGVEAR